jgi:hypothetical protein
MTTVAVTADWALHDSVQSVTALLRRIAPIFAADVTDWTLDLSRCTYLGPDAAALLVACVIDAQRHGINATVQLPRGNPRLVAFIKYSGLEHYLTGAPPPTADPDIVIPARVQTTSNFSDPDPIINLLARHAPVPPETEEFLRICINEVIQNVEDHARSDVGCVTCARFLENMGQVRVAIVDRGRGIGSSLREKYPEIPNTAEALRRVIEGGYSAKSRPNNMGVGISNLAGIIIRQLRGELFLVSEDAFADGKEGRLPTAWPLGASFPGTAVFFTVPLR